MRRIRRAPYRSEAGQRRMLQLAQKQINARMEESLDTSVLIDNEQMERIKERAYEEYMRRTMTQKK